MKKKISEHSKHDLVGGKGEVWDTIIYIYIAERNNYFYLKLFSIVLQSTQR